jgi:hypothetical protein
VSQQKQSGVLCVKERGAWFSHGAPEPWSSDEICTNRARHIYYTLQSAAACSDEEQTVGSHHYPKHYSF